MGYRMNILSHSSNRLSLFDEPIQRLSSPHLPEVRSHQISTGLVVSIQPIQLFAGHKFRHDHLGLHWDKGHSLKSQETPLLKIVLSFRLHHPDQSLNPNAKVSIFIVSWLVRQDHARLESRVIGDDSEGDAHGSLVDVEEGPNTVASAVEVVQTCIP